MTLYRSEGRTLWNESLSRSKWHVLILLWGIVITAVLWGVQEPVEDLDPERILDVQSDSRLHIISGGTKVVQHSPPLKASAGLKRNY